MRRLLVKFIEIIADEIADVQGGLCSGDGLDKLPKRSEDAMWHISCYSDKDRIWAEQVMKWLGCKNYRLYDTIDECLKELGEFK